MSMFIHMISLYSVIFYTYFASEEEWQVINPSDYQPRSLGLDPLHPVENYSKWIMIYVYVHSHDFFI